MLLAMRRAGVSSTPPIWCDVLTSIKRVVGTQRFIDILQLIGEVTQFSADPVYSARSLSHNDRALWRDFGRKALELLQAMLTDRAPVGMAVLKLAAFVFAHSGKSGAVWLLQERAGGHVLQRGGQGL